jgi:dTDP-4-amino-4,6-dideoxygalactose transaminase
VPTIPNHIEHAAYKCYIFVNGGSELRDKIMREINEKGVPCYSGSCSDVYLEKAFDNTGFRPKERLPVARELGETSLMFLVHPTLTKEEIQKTCDILTEVALDTEYLNRQSFWFDIKILWMTFLKVMKCDGVSH